MTRNVVVRNSLTGEQEIRPINEIASSHIARRTFVGNIYKKFKDQSLVSELSGHAPNSASFARYREVDEEMKREIVSAIDWFYVLVFCWLKFFIYICGAKAEIII